MAVKQYGWKDVSVVVLGRVIEGIEDVTVKRKVTKERQYGRGNATQNILSGNEEISGKLTIHQSELQAINTAVKAVNPLLDISKVSFEIVVVYEDELGAATTDIVRGVQVEEYEKSMAQGDTKMSIELPFMATAFDENVA
ncbi:MAG: hypothetical protein D6772_05815 [Bacteroidetes bacterium]|nr:MAG: hypothetical protein D6772_05815 [Bacteroidota bacterium]